MQPTSDAKRRAGHWLSRLGVLCASTLGADDAMAKASVYTDELLKEFPPDTFCDAALSALAAEFKYFPAYAELREKLAGWRRDHVPAPRAIAGPDAALPDNAVPFVKNWQRLSAEGWQPTSLHYVHPKRLLAFFRDRSPAAFEHLCQHDDLAADIARRNGWQ